MAQRVIQQEVPGEAKVVPMKFKEITRDGEKPAELITDHKWSPIDEWWTRCRHCRLAQAAHAESELQYYGDDET